MKSQIAWKKHLLVCMLSVLGFLLISGTGNFVSAQANQQDVKTQTVDPALIWGNKRINDLNNQVKGRMEPNDPMLLPAQDGLYVNHQNVNAYLMCSSGSAMVFYSQGVVPVALNDPSLKLIEAYTLLSRQAYIPPIVHNMINYQPESRFATWPKKEYKDLRIYYGPKEYVIYQGAWQIFINRSAADHQDGQELSAKTLATQVVLFLAQHNLPQTSSNGRIDLSTTGNLGRENYGSLKDFKMFAIWEDQQHSTMPNTQYDLNAKDPMTGLKMLTSLKEY